MVNKYNNTYHSTNKMEPVDVNSSANIDLWKKIKKILNLKLIIMQNYLNIKTFLQKVTFHFGVKKFIW